MPCSCSCHVAPDRVQFVRFRSPRCSEVCGRSRPAIQGSWPCQETRLTPGRMAFPGMDRPGMDCPGMDCGDRGARCAESGGSPRDGEGKTGCTWTRTPTRFTSHVPREDPNGRGCGCGYGWSVTQSRSYARRIRGRSAFARYRLRLRSRFRCRCRFRPRHLERLTDGSAPAPLSTKSSTCDLQPVTYSAIPIPPHPTSFLLLPLLLPPLPRPPAALFRFFALREKALPFAFAALRKSVQSCARVQSTRSAGSS